MGQAVQERFDRQFQPVHFSYACIGRGNVAAEGFDVDVHLGIAIA